MKYLKKYEYIVGASGVYKFEDDYLKIFQIMEGPNRGKMTFKFYSYDNSKYDSYSFMFGATKLLDTNYINNNKIRNIVIIDSEHNKLTLPTKFGIIRHFFSDLGYDINLDRDILNKRYSEIVNVYIEELNNISTNSKTLGEVFDRLKKLRDVFFENETEIFKRYQLQKDADKYNL